MKLLRSFNNVAANAADAGGRTQLTAASPCALAFESEGTAMHYKALVVTCVASALLVACASDAPVYMARPAASGVAGNSAGVTAAAGPSGASGVAGVDQPSPLTPAVQGGAAAAMMAGKTGSVMAGSPPSVVVPSASVPLDRTGANNPAGLAPADVTKLIAGGPRGDMRWLYPYPGTVFPRGMIAPLVMWNGDPATDAVYLHIKSKSFEYKGVHKPQSNGALLSQQSSLLGTGTQLPIPQDVWDLAGQMTQGRDDPFTLEVSDRVNGRIRGPVSAQIIIAPSSTKGSIYYSTCATGLQNGGVLDVASGGKIVRIPPGGKAELFLSAHGDTDKRCQGCHSVSANGTRLIAQQGRSIEETLAMTGTYQGLAYQLTMDGRVESFTGKPVGPNASYAALYPDGSYYLSTALPAQDFLKMETLGLENLGRIRSWGYAYDSTILSVIPATLYDATNGQMIANTGVPMGAMMPMFSPDGRFVVFNDLNLNGGRGLAVMAYDTHTHKATAYKTIAQMDGSGDKRPGWPFFTPDNGAVVFAITEDPSFSSFTAGVVTFDPTTTTGDLPDSSKGYPSDLYIADVATGTVTLLAKAMGFNTPADADKGVTYLPFEGNDWHHNYFPTVAPVAAGGYFWVYFESLRHYGSIAVERALWGFAIDILPNGSYKTDPSHPPFYLPGQEFGTGNNHRPFAALDRCKTEGSPCMTGIDCCPGTTCSLQNSTSVGVHGDPIGSCAPPPPPPPGEMNCAKLDERCTTAADCCDKANYCINGFCAFVELL